MTLKPWREIAVPHDDVLNGTSLQSDFAADLSTVANGSAKSEYQDASLFYSRTYITEGMSLLLKNVIMRLNGKGGEPVIQLKTSFGGGKTHSMIAVYHLAKRQCSLQDLRGIPSLLDSLGFTDIPIAKVAVLDGNNLSPGQPWKRGSYNIQTLWGELAWQIGGEEAYKMIEESDINRTSPGKELLVSIFTKYGPCVLLIDELVRYICQLWGNDNLPAGTFNANLSFIQALTESCKIIPNCIMLASLPNSESELGETGAKETLEMLEKFFGRVQAIWKPVATEESFEIVRRRLFKEIIDERAKKDVCRAFYDMYIAEGNKMPSETQESVYLERLERAYPIHPQLFDTLYEEWATLEKFQKTRGTLKLLSTIIYALWKQENRDFLIMNASIPISDGKISTEMCSVLNGNGWEQVINRDIDGEFSETPKIDLEDTRIGSIQCAKKVARTIFIKTAPIPSDGNTAGDKRSSKGVSFDYILLGSLQPGQNSSLYVDALSKLSDRLHYLSVSGSGSSSEKRYYRFATHANMRKEMEERSKRIKDDDPSVRSIMQNELSQLTKKTTLFDSVHYFTENADVPDDEALRLVFLSPNSKFYGRNSEPQEAQNKVKEYITNCGNRMRIHQNRLLFVAADSKIIGQVEDTTKKYLAWKSIIEDAKNMRLNVDMLQLKNAENECESAKHALSRQIQSCWKNLLVPVQEIYDKDISIDIYTIGNRTSFIDSIEAECIENEIVIKKWGAIHLSNMLQKVFWNMEKKPLKANDIWEATTKFLYLERIKSKKDFMQTIQSGALTKTYFALADRIAENDSEKLLGLHFGENLPFIYDDMLIVPIELAQSQIEKELLETTNNETIHSTTALSSQETTGHPEIIIHSYSSDVSNENTISHFYMEHQIQAGMLTIQANKIYEEIVSILTQSVNADVNVTISVEACFKSSADDNTVRAINENANTLGIKKIEWS